MRGPIRYFSFVWKNALKRLGTSTNGIISKKTATYKTDISLKFIFKEPFASPRSACLHFAKEWTYWVKQCFSFRTSYNLCQLNIILCFLSVSASSLMQKLYYQQEKKAALVFIRQEVHKKKRLQASESSTIFNSQPLRTRYSRMPSYCRK